MKVLYDALVIAADGFFLSNDLLPKIVLYAAPVCPPRLPVMRRWAQHLGVLTMSDLSLACNLTAPLLGGTQLAV